MEKIIAIGCDHAGYSLKEVIKKHFDEKNIKYVDFGTYGEDSVDYPVYAGKVSEAVQSGNCSLGILICGTGIGMSMAANKHKNIRAAVCTDVFSAQATRSHNDANICCLGSRVLQNESLAKDIADAFIFTDFSNDERHIRRVNMLNALDGGK